MSKLFDDPRVPPKTAARRYRQFLSDTLEECRGIANSTRDDVAFSNETAHLLIDLAEQSLTHRPLSRSGKFARDLVIWRNRRWRQEHNDKKTMAPKTATLKAVERAMSEIKGLAEFWGDQIVLNEKTVRDRICRKANAPRLQFWWAKK
jgi:hypothetical protein